MATLAKLLPRAKWDRIRRDAYRRAGYRCAICGKNSRLHCHEVWHFNERTAWQWLTGFRALCEDCHGVKHILAVNDRDRFLHMARHFIAVNKVGWDEFRDHLRHTSQTQRERNNLEGHIGYGDHTFHVPPLKKLDQRRKRTRKRSRAR